MLRRRRRHNIRYASPLSFSLFPPTFSSHGHGPLFLRYLPERKPGHPDKLFQYCSTDINTLVQRQIRVRPLDLFLVIIYL